MNLDFTVIPAYLDVVLLGAVWTIAITVAAALLSFVGGIIFAVVALYAPLVVRLPFRLFCVALQWARRSCCSSFLIYFGLVQIRH